MCSWAFLKRYPVGSGVNWRRAGVSLTCCGGGRSTLLWMARRVHMVTGNDSEDWKVSLFGAKRRFMLEEYREERGLRGLNDGMSKDM